MPITRLRFTNVGPFDDIEFEFDPQVNVFTGPNNSGKSTALWVLGDISVWPFTLPRKLLRSEKATWEGLFRFAGELRPFSGSLPIPRQDEVKELLERVGYTTFVPALRHSTDFRSKGPMAHRDTEAQIEQLITALAQSRPDILMDYNLEDFRNLLRTTQSSEGSEWKKRLGLFLSQAAMVSDEAVIQKIIDLDYRAYRRNEPGRREIVNRIAQIASEITEGFPIQFLGIGEDGRGHFPQFQTPDGVIPLNVLSQGTQSIIQWLAHLLIGYAEYYDYPPNLEEKPGILIIDEIDAHLHPSWQRRIIPTLVKHFPNLQIFCSTHSPLMLAGLKAGQVQLLRRDDRGKVSVSRNETDIVGWSADEILRNVLDVLSPTDLETVEHIKRMQELMDKESLSAQESEELETLRHTINLDLLGGPVAGQVERLADTLKQIKAEFAARPKQPTPSRRGGTTRRRSRLVK